MSQTEQTGRVEMDSTESQPRIEAATLGLSPNGGDPTPLPIRRAASGTRTKLKAVPPPIPTARASTQTIPPPMPVIQAAAQKPAMQPDPDGWAVPASGPSFPSVYHHEPAAPDETVPTGAIEAAAEKPSPAWLAKIDSVMAGDPVDDKVVNAHEKAVTEAREAEELARANAAANAALPKLPTARPSNAKLPPPSRTASGTRPPVPTKAVGPVKTVPPVAAAAAAMFTTKAKTPTADAPHVTAPLELVDLEPVDRSDAHDYEATPLPPPTPTDHAHDVLAKPAKPGAVNPLVEAARKSFEAEQAGDFDIDWDSNPEMTSAHTTNFELPVKSKLASRAALGLLVAAVFATVGYLATRSKSSPKHAAPTVAAQPAAAEPVAAQPTAPAPVAAQPTAPAPAPAPAEAPTPAVAQTQPVAAPVEAPKAPTASQQLQIPVSSMPPGAFVTLVDGDKADIVGQTPMTLSLDVSKPHDIALTMVGRETQLVHVPTGGLNTLAVTLPLKEGAQPAVAAAPAPAPKASAEHVTAMVQPKQETPAPRHKAQPQAEPQHVAAPAPRAVESAPAGSGVLMISSKPPCEIIVDGKSTHLQTPQRALPLSAGAHTVMLVNAQMHIKKQIAVDIVAKKPTKVIQDFLKN
ncbi:MAG: hypothetical protein JO257_10120 [Deltaproteobacteria bacterium]|nr:hypothetical protein [Deltaproteobacteria bacterium]